MSRFHSQRCAIIGSTSAARRAGLQHASAATVVNNTPIVTNVRGAVALTPNNNPETNLVSPSDASSPIRLFVTHVGGHAGPLYIPVGRG